MHNAQRQISEHRFLGCRGQGEPARIGLVPTDGHVRPGSWGDERVRCDRDDRTAGVHRDAVLQRPADAMAGARPRRVDTDHQQASRLAAVDKTLLDPGSGHHAGGDVQVGFVFAGNAGARVDQQLTVLRSVVAPTASVATS